MKKLLLLALLLSGSAFAVTTGYLDVGQNATLFQGVPLSLTSPSNGQCYVYNSTSNLWAPNSCGGGGGGGATGATGATGGTGASGSAGAAGATGASGSNGSAGAAGATGQTGATGAVGSIGTFSATSTANGLDVTGSILTLHAGDGINPGALTTAAQTMAGVKTFTSTIVAPSGVTAGTSAAQTAAAYIRQSTTTDTGLLLANSNNTRLFSWDYSTAGRLFFGKTGSNYIFEFSDAASGGTGVNWMSIGPNGQDSPPAYPVEFNTAAADGAVTALSAIKANDGANINSAPWVVNRNGSATVNTIVGWVTTGSSRNPMSFIGTRNAVQTAAAEQSTLIFATQNAGTLTEVMEESSTGQLAYKGNKPSMGSCGTSPALDTNANDVTGTITVGSGGSATSCALTFAATWPSTPKCFVSNQTQAVAMQIAPTTTTLTITVGSAFTAGSLLDYHCMRNF